jgi:hypothetical protein
MREALSAAREVTREWLIVFATLPKIVWLSRLRSSRNEKQNEIDICDSVRSITASADLIS